jgi:hypothetical protein
VIISTLESVPPVGISPPTTHGEAVFLNVSVAVILTVIVVLVLLAFVRRRRRGGRGRWWQGEYAAEDDVTIYDGRGGSAPTVLKRRD